MTDHEHGHDHTADWRAALEAARHHEKHYYEHQFDWRGHVPPPGFDGPRFFPIAEAWRVMARLDTAVPGAGDGVTLPTSTGKLREMTIAGQLVFDVEGVEQRLTMFIGGPGDTHGFVPFRDATSGQETYGAGRYLDVEYEPAATEYMLDFNSAYNPRAHTARPTTAHIRPPAIGWPSAWKRASRCRSSNTERHP
jgi:uncharacterized protein